MGAEASPLRPVDHAALRTNQAVIIGLLIAAYIADAPVVVAAVGLLMLIGAARTRPAFGWFYSWLRRPGWLRPDVVSDNPEPHRFAQLLGGVFLGLSAAGLRRRVAGRRLDSGGAGGSAGGSQPVRRSVRRLRHLLLAGALARARLLEISAARRPAGKTAGGVTDG